MGAASGKAFDSATRPGVIIAIEMGATAQPTLQTARLTLALAASEDVDALWAIWRDPQVRRYLFDDEPVSRETAVEVLGGCLDQASAGLGLWTIRAADVAIIGCVGLMPVNEATAENEPRLRGLIEPIVALAPTSWGRGFADEALAAVLTHAFRTLDLERVAGVTDVPNEASHRMLVRAGFEVLGEGPGPHYRLRTYHLERARFARCPTPKEEP